MKDKEGSKKSWFITLILCIFSGFLGVHRFYVGKYGTGVLWVVTGGLIGFGWIIDLISIANFNFKDSNGEIIK